MNKKVVELIEDWFTRLSLIFFTGNPISLLLFGGRGGDTFNPNDSNFLEPIISLAIYGTALILLLVRWKQTINNLIRRDKIIWLVMLLILASTFWSAYPDITFRRSILLLGCTCFGLHFSTRYSLEQQFRIVTWAYGWVLAMCVVFAMGLPQYGVMTGEHAGAWRGVYMHKNNMGMPMALSTLLFLLSLLGSGRRSIRTWAGCLGSFFLVVLSNASTALVTLLALLPIVLLGSIFRFRKMVLIPALIFLLIGVDVVFLYLITNAQFLLDLLGEDATLTGRTELWSYVWMMIQRHPWLGYGYEGFWRDFNSNGAEVWRLIGWLAPHAHNGFLELLLIFGWIGTSIFMLGFLANFFKSLTLIHRKKTFESIYFLVLLTYIVLTNVVERNILSQGGIWILYISTCLLSLQQEKAVQLNSRFDSST